ncbi:MAG: hypothetical protein WBW79_10720 [Desulfocapsaceae bacterium]
MMSDIGTTLMMCGIGTTLSLLFYGQNSYQFVTFLTKSAGLGKGIVAY